MSRETIFSPDRLFRYTLWRECKDQELDLAIQLFAPRLANRGYVNFICLNPSTADEKLDDPTIKKCVKYAKRWGYSEFCMTNIFAFRATDPEVMKKHPTPIGEHNNQHIIEVAKGARLVVCGWGNHGSHLMRGDLVRHMLRGEGIKMHSLKVNADSSPQHPLYLKDSQIPKLYE